MFLLCIQVIETFDLNVYLAQIVSEATAISGTLLVEC